MSDLGWRAEGIQRALDAGGIPLELYRRPGFGESRTGVRRADVQVGGAGFDSGPHWYGAPDPDPYADSDD